MTAPIQGPTLPNSSSGMIAEDPISYEIEIEITETETSSLEEQFEAMKKDYYDFLPNTLTQTNLEKNWSRLQSAYSVLKLFAEKHPEFKEKLPKAPEPRSQFGNVECKVQ